MTPKEYISSKQIIAEFYEDNQGWYRDPNGWVYMLRWIGDAMEFCHTYPSLEKVVRVFTVKDGRLAVPAGLHSVLQIAYGGKILEKLTGTFDYVAGHSPMGTNAGGTGSGYGSGVREENGEMIVASQPTARINARYGYVENPGWFLFNFQEGEVTMSYTEIPHDENNFPMVPNHVSFRKACLAYIMFKLKYAEYAGGKLNESQIQRFEDDWQWYCGQARAEANKLDLGDMEGMKDGWLRMTPYINHAKAGFIDINMPERFVR
jgi:hypothetical protein